MINPERNIKGTEDIKESLSKINAAIDAINKQNCKDSDKDIKLLLERLGGWQLTYETMINKKQTANSKTTGGKYKKRSRKNKKTKTSKKK